MGVDVPQISPYESFLFSSGILVVVVVHFLIHRLNGQIKVSNHQ